MKPKGDVVDISSSDTEALLDSLFLSRARNSLASHPQASSDVDSIEDWPEANDMAAIVYVVLSADALSSRTPVIDAPRGGWKSCFDDSSIRKMKKTRRRKAALTDAPRKRSKEAKVDVNRALGAPTPRDGSLLATDFDKSEWEIMYPLFVAEGLIDPSVHVNRRNIWRLVITVKLCCAPSHAFVWFILSLAFLLYVSLVPTFERFSICLYLIFLSLLHSLTFGFCNLCGGLVVFASFKLHDEYMAWFAGFVDIVSPVDFQSCVYPVAWVSALKGLVWSLYGLFHLDVCVLGISNEHLVFLEHFMLLWF
jgi:hypothetical protein